MSLSNFAILRIQVTWVILRDCRADPDVDPSRNGDIKVSRKARVTGGEKTSDTRENKWIKERVGRLYKSPAEVQSEDVDPDADRYLNKTSIAH